MRNAAIIFIATGLAAVGLSATTARAQNIVANPGFESDTVPPSVTPPTDWSVTSVTDPASGTTESDAGVDNALAHSGNNDAYLSDGTLSQTLTTVAGTIYDISFWVAVNDLPTFTDPSASFDVSFGGTDMVGGTPIIPSGLGVVGTYTEFTDTVAATSNSTTISFTGLTSDDLGTWFLDDVDVEALPAVTAVPEPPALLLLLPAVALLGMLRSRASRTLRA